MNKLSGLRRSQMSRAYDHNVARRLVLAARLRQLVTYGELSSEFGRANQGWGPTLNGIAVRCNDKGLPALSVLVVSQDTGQPSLDAALYEALGLDTPEKIAAEQERCFSTKWAETQFGRDPKVGPKG